MANPFEYSINVTDQMKLDELHYQRKCDDESSSVFTGIYRWKM